MTGDGVRKEKNIQTMKQGTGKDNFKLRHLINLVEDVTI